MNYLQELLDRNDTALTVTDCFKMIADYGLQTGEALGSKISDLIDRIFD